MTVEQLEQALAAAQASPDAVLAERISSFELIEPLSASRWTNLKATLPGDKSRQAQLALADMPAPSLVEQRQRMALVVGYATKAVYQLPNLFTTHATTRYKGRPLHEYGYFPLHVVGNSSRTVPSRGLY
jgi:hypothetical protein